MAKSRLVRNIDIRLDGKKYRLYEPLFDITVHPSSDIHGFADVSMRGYMTEDEAAELVRNSDYGLKPGIVITDEIPPDTVSFENWVKSIAKGKDVYLPSDIMLKALKEYFDKILTNNDKE